ncbi:MAG: hypothetical protein IT198_11125 [Acidimicrobiia bacterium]|nr:hypothetical protein [Acidimicrobiia bacterium]
MSDETRPLDYRPMLRTNPFGDPAIVAEGRSRRPHDSRRHAPPSAHDDAEVHHDPECPFCTGNEDRTPPEVDALRPDGTEPDTPGWEVRVVPNLYPALLPDSDTAVEETGDLFSARPSRGRHEVAIHSPDHAGRLSRLDPARLERAIHMWQRRLAAHRREGWEYTVLAVNEGREAGASLAHPHAQLFASDYVPPSVTAAVAREQQWARSHGSTLLGAAVAAERGGPRHVDTEGDLVAWSPFWSRVRYEVWIAPAGADSPTRAFADSPHTRDLASLLGRIAARVRTAADDPPLNVVFRDVPHSGAADTWWHVRVLPRTQVVAGYELGSDVQIVTLAPEEAAADLRAAL